MAPIFGPAANLLTKLILLGIGGGMVVLVMLAWWGPYSGWTSGVGFKVTQPVPFSHRHHVAGLGLDCRFCHADVESAATAGMPPTTTCMTCHSQIWTNAAILAPVRESLARETPIHWQRVNHLPDYVYFDHSIHIAKGIGCISCHGRVDEMALTSKQANLRMAWCLDCHRDPAPHLRPPEALFDMAWQPSPATPPAMALAQQYHLHTTGLTDCSVCHR